MSANQQELFGQYEWYEYVNGNNVTCFKGFELNVFQKKLKKSQSKKTFKITTKIYRKEANDTIMCEYVCIGLCNNVMLKDKNVLVMSNIKGIIKYF